MTGIPVLVPPAVAPPTLLDRLHGRVRSTLALQRFTAFTRVLLAVGFVPPGLKKVLGERFTSLPVTHPVGSFFEAFFQAHAFYAFVGGAQIAAALLLVVPATATLGAVVYFPIILTIAVITLSMGFAGTGALTVLMALACLYLLCWDYDRLKVLLPARRVGPRAVSRREYAVQGGGWALAGVAAYGVAAYAGIGALWPRLGAFGFALGAAGGAAFGLVLAWHLRLTGAR